MQRISVLGRLHKYLGYQNHLTNLSKDLMRQSRVILSTLKLSQKRRDFVKNIDFRIGHLVS